MTLIVVNILFDSECRQLEARTSRIGHGNRAFAPFITFLFLSILARMCGSRDLCVTPLLLADGILSRTIYSSSLVTRAGLQDFSKQPKSTRLCEKETICFNASSKSYESILKEQKAMKLTFEILIPLSIFKQTEDASPICLLSDEVTTEWFFTQIESVAPLTEQKTMKLTLEILILLPLSIFKQMEDASRICIQHDFKKPFSITQSLNNTVACKNETFVPHCNNYLFSWVNVCSMIFPHQPHSKIRKQWKSHKIETSWYFRFSVLLCDSTRSCLLAEHLQFQIGLKPPAPKSSILLKFTRISNILHWKVR